MISVVIPVWGEYGRFWPRAWADVARQARTGAEIAEVVVVRPSDESRPSNERLGAAFEREAGLPPPEIRDRHLKEEEKRLGLARNAGLDSVSSPLVSFVDVDNMTAPWVWRILAAAHERHPGLGSAAVGIVRRLPDGTMARPGAPAHRWDRRPRLGPRIWDQALLWNLAVRAAVLAPAAGAVHSTEAVRASGGFGHGEAFVDMVFTVASLACAPGLYLPRFLGTLYAVRPGSTYWRPRPRREVLDVYDEIEARLGLLGSQGGLRPSVAAAMPLIRRGLKRRRARLERVMPIEGWPVNSDSPGPGGVEPSSRHPWVRRADEEEARMADLLNGAG
jgi:Glycosyl transferase family 2